jgi:hypothetical protein
MNPCSPAPSTSLQGAHILIHSDTVPITCKTRFQATLRKLRLLADRSTDASPIHVQIHDLRGHCVFGIESAEPLLDVVLPAGTYHVNAQLGTVRRSYTMAIEPGTSFNLYLRLRSHLH